MQAVRDIEWDICVGLFTPVDNWDKYVLLFMTKALSCQI